MRMTMLSFRIEGDTAAGLQRWSDLLGVDRSELLREAVRRHLALLAAEHDTAAWADLPLTAEEASLGDAADWGPAEDWSDWADATR